MNLKTAVGGVLKRRLARIQDKSKAAKLLSLPNYQMLTNWLKKYGLE